MGSDFGGDCGANAGGRRGFEEIWRQGRLNRVKILQVTTPDLPPNPEQAQPGEGPGLKQTLGLFSATAIVIGSMMGAISGLLYIKISGKDAASYQLPFGTFLSAAALLVAAEGPLFIGWYASLLS